jgi:hypothetical protein
MTPGDPRSDPANPDQVRHAEAALKKFGYSRVDPGSGTTGEPDLWVQESGVPRRRFPVFLGDAVKSLPLPDRAVAAGTDARRGIVVVTNRRAAEAAWQRTRRGPTGAFDSEFSILVVPEPSGTDSPPYWHTGRLDRRDLLRLSTGIVVGLFRRAAGPEGGSPIDFAELLSLLKRRFGVDVTGTLGVSDDEDALFLLYQMAQRFSWAPGDGGASLHMLVLKPTGPAARLPWFAA